MAEASKEGDFEDARTRGLIGDNASACKHCGSHDHSTLNCPPHPAAYCERCLKLLLRFKGVKITP